MRYLHPLPKDVWFEDFETWQMHQNEKRKDKELTEHINKILRARDELLQDADIGAKC